MGNNDDRTSGFSTKGGTGTASVGLGGNDHYRLGSLRGCVPGRRRSSTDPEPSLETDSGQREPAAPSSIPEDEVTPVDPLVFQVERLGLPDDLVSLLRTLGYTTSYELTRTPRSELLDERGIGAARLALIVDALAKVGQSLAD